MIQGDGVTLSKIEEILEKVLEAGFSAENVAFGMGGGLLQAVNRDTMSFATKLCLVVVVAAEKEKKNQAEAEEAKERDGNLKKNLVSFDVMKSPVGDRGKASLPGALAVARDPETGLLTAVPAAALRDREGKGGEEDVFSAWRGLADELELVFDCGLVPSRSKPGFDELRLKVKEQWESTPRVNARGAVHPALREWAEEVRRSGGRKESKWK